MPNRHENAVSGDYRGLFGGGVAHLHLLYAVLVAANLLHHSVKHEIDFRIALRTLHHDAGSTERGTPMNKGDGRAETGQEISFFESAVAAADHHNRLVAEEETIASGAVGDTFACVFRLAWHAQLTIV